MKRKDFHLIEPDKDIVLHCSDFMGEYKIEGRMVRYKGGKMRLRFCRFNEITKKYESDFKIWSEREFWEYKSNDK